MSAVSEGREIVLTERERQVLEGLARDRAHGPHAARRASIILLAAEGHNNLEICELCGCSPQTVTCWRRRWRAQRLEGLRRRGARHRH